MPGCPKHTRPILFLWGFNEEGNPYIDSRLDINADPEKAASLARIMEIRMRYQGGTHMALFHIPLDMTIEDVESYINNAKSPHCRANIIEKLKLAEINLGNHLGKKSESNAINFINDLCKEECNCYDKDEE